MPIYTQGILIDAEVARMSKGTAGRKAAPGPGQIECLKELALTLEDRIAGADDKSLPGIARQYREALRDIRELEGGVDDGDEVEEVVVRLRSGKQ